MSDIIDPICAAGEELQPAGDGYTCGPADQADPTVKLEHPILQVPVISEPVLVHPILEVPVIPAIDVQLPTLSETTQPVSAVPELAYTGVGDFINPLIPAVLLAAGVVLVIVSRVRRPKQQPVVRRFAPLVSRDWDDRFTDVGGSRAPVPGRDAMSSRKP